MKGDGTVSHTRQDTSQVNAPWNDLNQISEFPRDLTQYITRDGKFPVASGGCADIYKGTLHMSQAPIKVRNHRVLLYGH